MWEHQNMMLNKILCIQHSLGFVSFLIYTGDAPTSNFSGASSDLPLLSWRRMMLHCWKMLSLVLTIWTTIKLHMLERFWNILWVLFVTCLISAVIRFSIWAHRLQIAMTETNEILFDLLAENVTLFCHSFFDYLWILYILNFTVSIKDWMQGIIIKKNTVGKFIKN